MSVVLELFKIADDFDKAHVHNLEFRFYRQTFVQSETLGELSATGLVARRGLGKYGLVVERLEVHEGKHI